ncbi:MAG: hypothetical protein ACRCX2_34245 [Paraclostridium sp.]
MDLQPNLIATVASISELKDQVKETNIQLSNYIIDVNYTNTTLLEIFNNTLEAHHFTQSTFTSKEATIYACNPKLLCLDVYGKPELFFLLMRANNMPHIGDFTPEKLENGILMINDGGLKRLQELFVFYKTKLYRDGDFKW